MQRPGWTRIELLLCLIVLVTATGLLATLLLYSRSPAQRLECEMHLKTIGAAVHAFHDDRKTLPASCIAPGYATWAVQISPYLKGDEGKALNQWNVGLSFYDQPAQIREGQVGVYYCPARRFPVQLSISGDVPISSAAPLVNHAGALGDYGCSPTSDNTAYPWTSPDADGAVIVGEVLEKSDNKILRWKARTTLEDLRRGQTYTILLGEKHVSMGEFGQGRFGDGSLYNGDYPASFARIVDERHPLALEPTDPFNLNFGSWHPGICQFLMADGRVYGPGNSVSPSVLQKLIPRGSGE
jgi:hypothetical protein